MPNKLVLGIDLGTTYSCVARLDENERPVVLPNSDSEYTTPSVVHYEESGGAVVGKYAKKELDRDRDNVVTLIKRHMGEPDYTIHVRGQDFYPSQVSAVILRKIVEDALTEVGAGIPAEPPLADVVITVPAYFGTAERNATVDAGKMAGLNVLNIINEPTAAAIAYGVVDAGSPRTVLVYDLGGGTFDVTVIKVSENEIRVIATGGDNELGGADWDQQIVEMLAEEFAVLYPDKGDPRTDREAGDSLTVLAEEVKKTLQKRESDTVTLVAHGERAKIEISRAGVLERTDHLVTRTVDFVRQVMEAAAGKGVTQYDELLLVGGMSRFHITARLAKEFPDLPEPRLMDPDQIVAKGAALYAAHQVAEVSDPETKKGSSSDGSKLLPGPVPVIINVASKGYGIKAVDGERDEVGHVEWLIQPNDEIPASPRETFRTVSHNQTAVNVQVFESMTDQLSRVIADHKEMVAGILTGLPSGRPPGQPIDVYCNLGDDGILYVTATADGQELKLNAEISGATPQAALDAPLPNISR